MGQIGMPNGHQVVPNVGNHPTTGQKGAVIPPQQIQQRPNLPFYPNQSMAMNIPGPRPQVMPSAPMGMRPPAGVQWFPNASGVSADALQAQIRARAFIQQQQPQPPAPVRKEPKPSIPKFTVNTIDLSFAESIASSGVSPGFLARKDFYETSMAKSGDAIVWSPSATVALAMALKLRMIKVVQQCVWFARRRCGCDLPPNPTITDVPMARFALLKAENEILKTGRIPSDKPPDDCDSALDALRNEAILGILARMHGVQRDEIMALAKDSDEQQDESIDYSKLMGLMPEGRNCKAVTVGDVCSFLEVDEIVLPIKRRFWMIRHSQRK
jgi:hypothetical protein